jgi:hypothetical protein
MVAKMSLRCPLFGNEIPNKNNIIQDNQEQINSMIKRKLLEIERVKEVWNK